MFDEKEFIPKILKGNLAAFDLLVKQYERLVFHVCFKLLNNNDDVQDVCQEVFIKVFRNLKGFRYQSKLSTWIAKIAYLTALNHIKKNKYDSFESYPKDVAHDHFTRDDPEHQLINKDVNRYLNELIAKLPHQYRLVLTLFHLEEFSYQEIEEVTGWPEGTVKSYLFRGRKLLKEKLEIYLKAEIK
jgi:RNA polymerase sigma factor (sigma-70 family)